MSLPLTSTALEVVPVALRRVDPVAEEDQGNVVKVDRARAVHRRAQRDLVALGQLERLAVAEVERHLRRGDPLRFQQRDILEPRTLAVDHVAGRLDARGLELVGDVIDRLGLGARRGTAALERVGPRGPVDVRQALRAERAGRSGEGRDGGNERGRSRRASGSYSRYISPQRSGRQLGGAAARGKAPDAHSTKELTMSRQPLIKPHG